MSALLVVWPLLCKDWCSLVNRANHAQVVSALHTPARPPTNDHHRKDNTGITTWLMLEGVPFIVNNVFNATSNSSLQRKNEHTGVSPRFVKQHALQQRANFCWQRWDIGVLDTPRDGAVQWGGIYLHGRLRRERGLCLVCNFYTAAWMKRADLGNRHVHLTALLLLFYLIPIFISIYTESSAVSPCETKVWLVSASLSILCECLFNSWKGK